MTIDRTVRSKNAEARANQLILDQELRWQMDWALLDKRKLAAGHEDDWDKMREAYRRELPYLEIPDELVVFYPLLGAGFKLSREPKALGTSYDKLLVNHGEAEETSGKNRRYMIDRIESHKGCLNSRRSITKADSTILLRSLSKRLDHYVEKHPPKSFDVRPWPFNGTQIIHDLSVLVHLEVPAVLEFICSTLTRRMKSEQNVSFGDMGLDPKGLPGKWCQASIKAGDRSLVI